MLRLVLLAAFGWDGGAATGLGVLHSSWPRVVCLSLGALGRAAGAFKRGGSLVGLGEGRFQSLVLVSSHFDFANLLDAAC